MGKFTYEGFQKSVDGMPQGPSIVMGKNLRSSSTVKSEKPKAEPKDMAKKKAKK